MKNFDWNNFTKIFFGKNKIVELSKQLSEKNVKKVLLVYGYSSIKKNGIYDDVISQLSLAGVSVFELCNIDPNPRITSVMEGRDICIKNDIDLILAVGGGSVIDCAKAISLARYHDGDFWDLIKASKTGEVSQALPIGVVLTLSATGSEMNNRAVISNVDTNEKMRVVNDLIYPQFSILDPEYTYSLPHSQIVAGVVDSFSHCLEQLFSEEKDAIVSDGILLGIMWSLHSISSKILDNPENYSLRSNLMWASTMALNGISGAGKLGDWGVHNIEHSLSACFDVTHAVGLAIIYPAWMKYILDESNVDRFLLLGSIFYNDEISDDSSLESKFLIANEIIDSISMFFSSMGMPSKLSEISISESDFDKLIQATFVYGSNTVGNVIKLNSEDVKNIFKLAL